MNKIKIIDGNEYRQYVDKYYISKYGDVYSDYRKKILKHDIDIDGYHRVDIHGKHVKVHKLVFLTWVGKIPKGKQINHRNDNRDDNYYKNLYAGSQKENMNDKKINNHSLGNMFYLVVFDYDVNTLITFVPASSFIEYSGHNSGNGSVKRMFSKKWFKKRFFIVEYKRIHRYTEIESVTTMWDECTTVE